MTDLVDQVATAILNETPANYVTQTIAQAYRNAEIALAIIEPLIRADERERIAQAIEGEIERMHLPESIASFLRAAAQIARSGGRDE